MEISLYERDGHPVAYIADDYDHSIYTWDGHAVCYIIDDKIFGLERKTRQENRRDFLTKAVIKWRRIRH